MQAHANPHTPAGKLRLRLSGSSCRLTRVGEDHYERVALRDNLDAAMPGERRAQDPMVLGERVDIPVA
jgi:hypothetical protein